MRRGWGAVILRAVMTILFLGAGMAKLGGAAPMVALFAAVGVGQWFRYAVGVAEVCGAMLLLAPQWSGVGAILLSGVMIGATMTQLLIIRGSPLLVLDGFVVTGSAWIPLAVLGVLLVIAWSHRGNTAAVAARVRARFTRGSKARRRGYEPS